MNATGMHASFLLCSSRYSFAKYLFFSKDTAPVDDNSHYGYIPTLYVCIIFVTLFGISTGKYFLCSTSYPDS